MRQSEGPTDALVDRVMTKSTPITLHYAPDNASLVVRIALEELGLPYEAVLVDRGANEQRSAAFLRLNPNGLIPACVIDGEVLFETAAIILILAERTGELFPRTGDPNRPGALKWLFWLSNTLHAELRLWFYPQYHVGNDPTLQPILDGFTRGRVKSHLAILDTASSVCDGPYLLGDQLTVVDIYAACLLRWPQIYPSGYRGSLTLAPYPNLLRLAQALEQRPAAISASAAEGIDGRMFSAPDYASPPEGSAL